jgi:hypothetical protein
MEEQLKLAAKSDKTKGKLERGNNEDLFVNKTSLHFTHRCQIIKPSFQGLSRAVIEIFFSFAGG